MITIRRSSDRGAANHGWLNSRHTFSFGHYYDPNFIGFGALRVINEDRVKPAAGFATHGHSDMEIISYVLDGALEHKDSIGTGSVIRPGDVQRMTAGTGIRHSEYNHSADEQVHFLQIWIVPEKDGLAPGYEQTAFPAEERRGKLRLVGSRDGRDGSLTIHQDVKLYAGLFAQGERETLDLAPGRKAWVQVARGDVEISGHKLSAGDGAAVTDADRIDIAGVNESEILVFDLAA